MLTTAGDTHVSKRQQRATIAQRLTLNVHTKQKQRFQTAHNC